MSDNPDATVVVADPITGDPGWVDVLAAGTAWPVRPLKTAISDPQTPSSLAAPAPHDATVTDIGQEVVEAASTVDSAGPQPVSAGGRMRVFGAFEVFDAHGVLLQPMQRDIIGGIFFHQPIGTHELCELLFGSVARPASFHVALSKMRKRGLHPVLGDTGYCIDIPCDWQTFINVVGPDPATADTDALAAAAAMIEGPLFGPTPPAWTNDVLAPMRAYSAAICRELAARHVDQPAAALGYARQGLTVDPGNAEIVEIIDTLTGQLAE